MFPDKGEVWLHGERVRSPRSTVGMAFQNPVLLEWRTILQNVILPLEIVAPSMPKRKKVERAMELLSLVGLEGFEGKRPSELSGGMRQRASLCRSIVHKPDVLILDEPFGALDAFTREDLWQLMHKLRAEEPFTSVLITHDLRESVYLADQVVVLSGRPARPSMCWIYRSLAAASRHALRGRLGRMLAGAARADPDRAGPGAPATEAAHEHELRRRSSPPSSRMLFFASLGMAGLVPRLADLQDGRPLRPVAGLLALSGTCFSNTAGRRCGAPSSGWAWRWSWARCSA
jgi:ABC-type nitrate/sulfonate/bicarbonate transport system ATPase subunit